MLKSEGVIFVDIRKKRIVLDVPFDFVKYYQWFLHRKYMVFVDLPLFGSHITIANSKHHDDVDWAWAYKQYHGKKIAFEYDEDVIIGGRRKGFVMFYMKVFSEEIEQIKKNIGVIENNSYRGLHVTLGSIGKSNAAIRPWWYEMIEIK